MKFLRFIPPPARSRAAVLFALAIVPSAALPGATAGNGLRARIQAAEPGALIMVAAGVYEGPFVIDKSIRLHGEAGAQLQGTGRGHVVAVRAADVELAGFVIRQSGSNLSTDDAGVQPV